MLPRSGIVVGFLLIALGLSVPASADFFLWDMVASIGRDIKERDCWPDQYCPISTAAAQAPFCVMTSPTAGAGRICWASTISIR